MERLGHGAGLKALTINVMIMSPAVIANGKLIAAEFPCTIEQFLLAQKLLPRSVVVEHNGQAVAPSEFSGRQLKAGDKLEIVKIVAGG
jgi:thiamine biosynthesis protein ThiS